MDLIKSSEMKQDVKATHYLLLQELETLKLNEKEAKKMVIDKENQILSLLSENAIFKPGNVVDIRYYDDWKIGYGRLNRQELNGDWVWDMTGVAHDGCSWSYSSKPENIRLTKKQLR